MVGQYVAAAAAAVAASCVLLWNRHRRTPFGEKRAIAWWVAIAALDAFAAALCLAGIFGLKVEGQSGVARAIVIGVLGPLALRSPVGTRRIRGRIEAVGPTLVYDLARKPMDQELDERMTRLKRKDVRKWRDALAATGWTSTIFASRLREHVADLPARDTRDVQRIEERIVAALTVPTEAGKMKALLNVALNEHFTGLLEMCAEEAPEAEEQGAAEPA